MKMPELLKKIMRGGISAAKDILMQDPGGSEEKAAESSRRAHAAQDVGYIASETLSKRKTAVGKGVPTAREYMTKEDDRQFVADVMSFTGKSQESKVASPLMVLDAFKTITNMAGEVMKFEELQETKRREIEARKEENILKIKETSRMIELYLRQTHDERMKIFQGYFEVIDKALASDDTQTLALTLNAMNDLAKSSPFRNLANLGTVRTILADPNAELDI